MSENEELYKRMMKEFKENHPALIEAYENYRTVRDVFNEYLSHRQPIYITEVDTGTQQNECDMCGRCLGYPQLCDMMERQIIDAMIAEQERTDVAVEYHLGQESGVQ